MRYYMYKCNEADGGPHGCWGNWETEFFADSLVKDWGGHYSTHSYESANLISYVVSRGDVFVCYQTDYQEVIGFALLKDKRASNQSHMFRDHQGLALFLEPLLQLPVPFKIHDAKRGTVLEHSPAVNGQPMLRELTKAEMRAIVHLSGAPGTVLQGKRVAKRVLQHAEK
jgi:hypothetical protein